MGTPIGLMTHVFRVRLNCPEKNNDLCSIPLPLESPLGIYDGQQYRATGEWPAIFLCLLHGRAFAYQPDSIHLETEARGLGQLVPQMWKIECECAHENCGMIHTIYTARAPDRERVLKSIARWNPAIPCGDHHLVWRDELIRLTDFAFDAR